MNSQMSEQIKRLLNETSYEEEKAMKIIIDLIKDEKVVHIVASKLCDKHNLTRSVFVNAARLLNVAGVTQSRSLGMKGSMITKINDGFVNELINYFQ